ncbi:flagellar hook-length control protein FliK [Palleronia sp.]|uniref:flagellar hook-length control protein FliK n=1 Tax=Palleronia sp. TaxID=1940284 RepID=UPI0035C7EB47
MDAIHLILGQNGRPGRADAPPQPAAADFGAAFSRALAALEGKHADDVIDDTTEAPIEPEVPEEGEAAPEEATLEDVPAEELELGLATAPESVAEEVLPLPLGEVPATSAPADGSAEREVTPQFSTPAARTVSQPATQAPYPFAQTVALARSEQQVPPRFAEAPAVEAPINPDAPQQLAAQPEVVRSLANSFSFPPKLVGTLHPGEAVQETPAAIELEAAIEPQAAPAESDAADGAPASPTTASNRPPPQMASGVAFDTTATTAVEAKVDDGGTTRALTEGIGFVSTDPGLAQSRPTSVTTTAPMIEARPVLHSIAEASVKAQDGTVELRLSPEELGRVRISMSHHDLGLTVVLNVERDDTLALLRRHASELAAALREAGLGEANIQFADREQPSSQDPQRRTPGRMFGVLSESGTGVERPTLRPSGDGALDIRM